MGELSGMRQKGAAVMIHRTALFRGLRLGCLAFGLRSTSRGWRPGIVRLSSCGLFAGRYTVIL